MNVLTSAGSAKLKVRAERLVIDALVSARRVYSGALFAPTICTAINGVLMEMDFLERYLTESAAPTVEQAEQYVQEIESAVQYLRLCVEARREQWAQALHPRQVITGVSGQASLPL